mmetsp:Transcript_77444/g.196802  ORF Transcript_77444/g.196802 Transcript_77444/m.196802 type:complete len:257 (-) Transcript_77444:172-942(-)
MLRLHECNGRRHGALHDRALLRRPSRRLGGIGGRLLQELVRRDGLPADDLIVGSVVVEASLAHEIVQGPRAGTLVRVRPGEALLALLGVQLKKRPRVLLALEDSATGNRAVRRGILVFGQHRDRGLQVLEGLHAVHLHAVELGDLLLAERAGLGQGLLVGGQGGPQLLDRGRQLCGPRGRALDQGPQFGDLGGGDLDGLLFFVLAGVAPTFELLEEVLVLLHVRLESLRHLLEQVHNAGHRSVLATGAVQGGAPGL